MFMLLVHAMLGSTETRCLLFVYTYTRWGSVFGSVQKAWEIASRPGSGLVSHGSMYGSSGALTGIVGDEGGTISS